MPVKAAEKKPNNKFELYSEDQIEIVPARTLARWRSTGKGPAFVKVGRRVFYRHADVEAWLQQQTRQRTGQSTPPKRVA